MLRKNKIGRDSKGALVPAFLNELTSPRPEDPEEYRRVLKELVDEILVPLYIIYESVKVTFRVPSNWSSMIQLSFS